MRTASPNDDLAAPWETRPLVLIGREAELGRVERVLETARGGGSDVLVLRGQPGIGKTALLRAAIERAGGMTVLRTRGLEGEAELPFAGLAELCEPVLALRDRLPAAQAAALDGALELEPAAPQARLAIGAALLGLLSLAAEERPVLCVIDDLQWLDEPSLEALRFAARRLGADGVAIAAAQRPERDAAPGSRRSSSARSPPTARSSSCRPAARTRCPTWSRGACSTPPAATRSRCWRSLRCSAATSSRAAPRSRGRCRPARRSSACSRAGSRGSTRTPAARCSWSPPPRPAAATSCSARWPRPGSTCRRSRAPRAPGSSRSRRARSRSATRCCAPPPTTAPPPSPAATPTARSPAPCRRTTRSARGSSPPARTRPDETVAAALEAAALSARARTGFGPAAHAHLRAAELSPEPLQRARRLVEAARDLLPAGHPDVGLARLEQAERVLAIAEGSDVSAVATELRTLRAQLALRTGRTEEARELLRAQARRLQAGAPPMAAMLLLLSSLGAMALRDHLGWLADAERARELAGDAELLAALAMLSAGAARMTVPDVAPGAACSRRASAGSATSGWRCRWRPRSWRWPRTAGCGSRSTSAACRCSTAWWRPAASRPRSAPSPTRSPRAPRATSRSAATTGRSPTPRRRSRSPSRRARTRRW